MEATVTTEATTITDSMVTTGATTITGSAVMAIMAFLVAAVTKAITSSSQAIRLSRKRTRRSMEVMEDDQLSYVLYNNLITGILLKVVTVL